MIQEIRDTRNHFRLKKEIKEIKDIILRDIKNIFEYEKEEENYYKPLRVNNVWSNDYIEYKNNGYKNRILSVEEYPDKIRPYLKDIINDLKRPGTWKIQLTTSINFISYRNDNEDRVMQSKSNNIEIMISNEADEVIEELLGSLKNRYQNNLQSTRGSEFVFDYGHLMWMWIIDRFS